MKRGRERILVVDDESRYVWTIRINLEGRGYQVLTAANGQAAVKMVAIEEPDLVILDIKMPGMDGYEACQRIREFSTVPIIMLTALAQDADKVKGLNLGADDYVSKPFSIEELLARIRAALRRAAVVEQKGEQPVYQAGDLRIDLLQKRVFVGENEVHLTPLEYQVLTEMVRNAGRVLVPEYLLETVWGVGYEGENLLLRQVVHRLRRKIEEDPRHPQYIQTRPGSGYVFVSEQNG